MKDLKNKQTKKSRFLKADWKNVDSILFGISVGILVLRIVTGIVNHDENLESVILLYCIMFTLLFKR